MMSRPAHPVKAASVTFTSAALSATLSTGLFQPLDLVKTRIQTAANVKRIGIAYGGLQTTSVFGAITDVVRSETYRGLWKGTTPSMFRAVPSIALYFTTLHTMASALGKTTKQLTMTESLLIGGAARCFVGTSFLPFTVIKARYESGIFHYGGVMQAISAIWKTEGGKGLYGGLTATVMRDVPFSGFYLAFYMQGKRTLSAVLGTEQLPSFCNLPCGIVAGVLASLITQPADVVKTKMQTKVAQGMGTLNLFHLILQTEGVQGLFRGAMPRLVRRSCMAAFTWAFYEEIVKAVRKASDVS